MNQRIKELAEQAGIEEWWDSGNECREVLQEHLEKLAELIVRQCLGCCEQVISDPVPKDVDTWLNGGSQCIDEIKHHFGVEE